MSKGALFAALEAIAHGARAAARRDAPSWCEQVCDGIDWITESLPALMGDPQYALLNAKRLCEMVIDVVVAAELLLPGAVVRGEARARRRASSTATCWRSR